MKDLQKDVGKLPLPFLKNKSKILDNMYKKVENYIKGDYY